MEEGGEGKGEGGLPSDDFIPQAGKMRAVESRHSIQVLCMRLFLTIRQHSRERP
jgi:hypothetical protein